MEAQAEGAWCSSQKRHQSTEELNQYERSNDIFSQHIQPDSNASEDATVKSDIDTAHPNGLMTDDIQQSSATVASGSSNDKTNNSTSKEYSTWTIRDGEQTMSVPSPTNNPFTDDHESPVAIVEPTNSAAVSVDVDGGSPNPDTTFIEDADHKQEDDREDDHEVEPEDDQYNHYDAYQDEGPTTGEWREPYDESEQPYKSKTVEYSKCTWCRCMARRVVLVSGNEHDSCNCNCHEDMRMRDFDVNQNTVKRVRSIIRENERSGPQAQLTDEEYGSSLTCGLWSLIFKLARKKAEPDHRYCGHYHDLSDSDVQERIHSLIYAACAILQDQTILPPSGRSLRRNKEVNQEAVRGTCPSSLRKSHTD